MSHIAPAQPKLSPRLTPLSPTVISRRSSPWLPLFSSSTPSLSSAHVRTLACCSSECFSCAAACCSSVVARMLMRAYTCCSATAERMYLPLACCYAPAPTTTHGCGDRLARGDLLRLRSLPSPTNENTCNMKHCCEHTSKTDETFKT